MHMYTYIYYRGETGCASDQAYLCDRVFGQKVCMNLYRTFSEQLFLLVIC
jgi:hypothetical protein